MPRTDLKKTLFDIERTLAEQNEAMGAAAARLLSLDPDITANISQLDLDAIDDACRPVVLDNNPRLAPSAIRV